MLISCVMPTRDRLEFVPKAVECFLSQFFPCHAELVILDDGTVPCRGLVPNDSSIRYFRHTGTPFSSLGAKRNAINELARGDIIAHWDDDDYSDPHRLGEQYCTLVARQEFLVTGYSDMLFYTTADKRFYHYRYSGTDYVVGTSLCYFRTEWEKHPFPNLTVAEDNDFVLKSRKVLASNLCRGNMVARAHPKSTTTRKFFGEANFQPAAHDEIPEGFLRVEGLL